MLKPWSITWAGQTWTDDQATAGHALAVSTLLDVGSPWDAVSPWTSPAALASWITVLVAGTGGTLDEAAAAVYAAPIQALTDALADREAPDGDS